MSVDVVIPVFDGEQFLEDCVWAARARSGVLDAHYFLWDDCSMSAAVRTFLRDISMEPDVEVHVNPMRLGFQENCNRGAAAGSGDVVVFLNADTFAFPNWLAEIMREFEEHPEVCVVGAKLLYPFGRGPGLADRIQHAGVARNSAGWPYHIYHRRGKDDPLVNRRLEINAVTGACLAVRRDVFNALGGFDALFSGGQYEDVDLCWRVRRDGGTVVYQPNAVLYHYSHGSGEKWVQLTSERNRERLLSRWAGMPSDEELFGESVGFFETVDLRL